MATTSCEDDAVDIATAWTADVDPVRIEGTEVAATTDAVVELPFAVTNVGEATIEPEALGFGSNVSRQSCLALVDEDAGDGEWTTVGGQTHWRAPGPLGPGETRTALLRLRVECDGVSLVRFGGALGAVIARPIRCGSAVLVELAARWRSSDGQTGAATATDRSRSAALLGPATSTRGTVEVTYRVTNVGVVDLADSRLRVSTPRWWTDPGDRYESVQRTRSLPELAPGDAVSGRLRFDPPWLRRRRTGWFGATVYDEVRGLLARRRARIAVPAGSS